MSPTVHEFSGYLPVIHLGPGLDLPSYFVVISLSLIICILWLVKRAEARGLSRIISLDLTMLLMIGGFIGSRLFHVFFEEPKYYLAAPLRILEFWHGGFVWYGGVILGFASCYAYLKLKRLPLGMWLDLFAPVCALGYALGRVACWLTGCCYGRVCVLSDGFSFRHPTQAYAVVWELGVVAALLLIEKKHERGLFSVWLVLHGAGRIVMEVFRDDPRGPEPLGISISTWISIALIFIGAISRFRNYRQNYRQN